MEDVQAARLRSRLGSQRCDQPVERRRLFHPGGQVSLVASGQEIDLVDLSQISAEGVVGVLFVTFDGGQGAEQRIDRTNKQVVFDVEHVLLPRGVTRGLAPPGPKGGSAPFYADVRQKAMA